VLLNWLCQLDAKQHQLQGDKDREEAAQW